MQFFTLTKGERKEKQAEMGAGEGQGPAKGESKPACRPETQHRSTFRAWRGRPAPALKSPGPLRVVT